MDLSRKCTNCGRTNDADSKFCYHCGSHMSVIPNIPNKYKCNKCQLETRAYNAETVKFCNHCGASANDLTPLYLSAKCEPKTPMIICRCHRWNDAESKYCYSCGKKLDEKVIKNDGANPEKEQVKRTKKKTSDTEKIIISILLIALFIVFVCCTSGIGTPAVYALYLALKQIWNES